MLEINSISKIYPGNHFNSLDHFNIDIPDGQIISILGPNGAGKTTLVKCLATLLIPDSGMIQFEGKDVWKNIKQYRQNMSVMLGGERGLYQRLSGRDNVKYLMLLKGYNFSKMDRKIEDYFKRFSMIEAIDQRVETYSRGMKQKLHLIIALISEARLIILDEPTSGMDPLMSRQVRDMLKTYIKQHNKTLIMTSHLMREVEELSERVIIMNKGKKIYDGDPLFLQSFSQTQITYTFYLKYSDAAYNYYTHLNSSSLFVDIVDARLRLQIRTNECVHVLQTYLKPFIDDVEEFTTQQTNFEDAYIHYLETIVK